mmetsp:Transcript_139851/g.389722  ORF Transcript_139851/g.389722 Transcript_139851/m.389722 type:complete len:80 (-) Transcript_139851:6-245(-)
MSASREVGVAPSLVSLRSLPGWSTPASPRGGVTALRSGKELQERLGQGERTAARGARATAAESSARRGHIADPGRRLAA